MRGLADKPLMVEDALADIFSNGEIRNQTHSYTVPDDAARIPRSPSRRRAAPGHRSESAQEVTKLQRYGARALVTGTAGCGKTTVSRWLAVKLASRSLPRNLRRELEDVVPFYVPLRTLFRSARRPGLHHLADPHASDAGNRSAAWIADCLRDGQALLIVDGFDELSDATKSAAEKWLAELIRD